MARKRAPVRALPLSSLIHHHRFLKAAASAPLRHPHPVRVFFFKIPPSLSQPLAAALENKRPNKRASQITRNSITSLQLPSSSQRSTRQRKAAMAGQNLKVLSEEAMDDLM